MGYGNQGYSGGSYGHKSAMGGNYGYAGFNQGQYDEYDDTGHSNAGRREETSMRMSHAGRGSKNYKRSDERIEEDVHEALMRDAGVDATDIDVSVSNGEVTLSGEVDTRQARRRAEECIEGISGVRDIHNNLKARHGFAGNQSSSDRDVTQAAMRGDSGRSAKSTGSSGSRGSSKGGASSARSAQDLTTMSNGGEE
jgi:hypothetical protein